MNPDGPQTGAPREKSIWPMFLGAFALFVIFALAVQWMLASGGQEIYDEEAVRSQERYDILTAVTDENKALTDGYGWIDRERGVVHVPLEQAMAMVVAKLSAQGEPRPAYPIDPNVPLGSALKPGGLAAPQPTPPPFGAAAPVAPADEETAGTEEEAAVEEEAPGL